MFIFRRCLLSLKLLYFILLTSILGIRGSLSCLEGKEYYDSIEKECKPCKVCAPPSVVVTTCHIYSNTKCGRPKFGGGPLLEVIEDPINTSAIDKTTKQSMNKNTSKKRKLKNYEDNHKINLIHSANNKFRRKLFKDVKDLSNRTSNENSTVKLNKIKSSGNLTILLSGKSVVDAEEKIDYDMEEEIDQSNSNASQTLQEENTFHTFFFSDLGKIVVSSIVTTFDLILILILFIKFAQAWRKRKLNDTPSNYLYNQKMPHPSSTPIKCRFTAVLPSKKEVEYANVDSCLNSLITPNNSSNSSSSNWNNCSSNTLPQTSQENSTQNGFSNGAPAQSSSPLMEREPLLSSGSEIVESANMIQLYCRMPSPNPFTMDRLLEHRRAIGSTSVENNLYVDTWCSSPSPMLTRSQQSSIAPSPALSSLRKSVSNSTSSSPVTTRTFRATPAFTSFHPHRIL